MTRVALALPLVVCLLGCAAHKADSPASAVPSRVTADVAPAALPESPDGPLPTVASLLSHPPDLLLTLRPRALSRDRVYGPLLRKASEMASAYAGPTTLGTTALGVLEKTDEVVVAENDRGHEALVVLRGVPGDLDPTAVVDTHGRPVWRAVEGDVRPSVRELLPVDPSDAALFVVPGLVWLIASGPAIGQVRAALLRPGAADGLTGDVTPLLAVALRGEALVAQEPRLRQGSLAAIGTGLMRAGLELTAGTRGVILGKLTYATADTAIAATATAVAVAHAFRARLEAAAHPAVPGAKPAPVSNLDWLGGASITRSGTELSVEVPIPRRWLDVLSQADLAAPQAPESPSPGTSSRPTGPKTRPIQPRGL